MDTVREVFHQELSKSTDAKVRSDDHARTEERDNLLKGLIGFVRMLVRRVLAGFMVLSFVLLLMSAILIAQRIEEANRIDPLELETMTADQIIARVYEVNDYSSNGLSLLLPAFGFFGIVVGAIVYFLLEGQQMRRKGHERAVLTLVRGMLSDQERSVFDLLRSRGSLFQSEIASHSGFTKVKAHRIISDLERKGIVTRTAAGKQRVIRFHTALSVMIDDTKDGFTR